MTEPPTTPPEPIRQSEFPTGRGVRWSANPFFQGAVPPAEPYEPKPRARPDGWPKTGTAGASTHLGADEGPVIVPARPYILTSGCDETGDSCHPPRQAEPDPAELAAMADDLNAHGGLDETFVAELLRQAADPYADAKRGLGIVDPLPAPVKTTKPITYESIVEALEKIAPLGPTPLDVVKLTQEQIDAITASQPHATPSTAPWHFFGTPVELVETVEESTPYQLWREQAEAEHGLKVVAEMPSGVILGSPTRLADTTFNEWLRWYDAKPTRIVPFGEPFRPLADVVDEQPAAEPRPWWRRALDRVRRWR